MKTEITPTKPQPQPKRELLSTVENALEKILRTNPTDGMLLEVYKEEMKFQRLILECKTNIETQMINTGLYELFEENDSLEFDTEV